jgi:hypothetical protein
MELNTRLNLMKGLGQESGMPLNGISGTTG